MQDRPIDVYNNGDLLRDFTYIDDVVRAIVLIADKPAAPDPDFSRNPPRPFRCTFRVYNIGNAHPERLERFISLIEEYLGKTAKKELPSHAGR